MRLLVYQGERLVREATVGKDTVRLGRLATCDLVLDGEGVARFHAVIEESNGAFSVMDMGSPGGTLVEGKRVVRAALAEGTRIEIGSFGISVFQEQTPKQTGEQFPEQIGEAEIVSEIDEPDTGEMMLVEVNDELVAARPAKVLWSATAEEMSKEPVTGEISVRQAIEQALEEMESKPDTGETPIPLTVRRRR